MAPIRWNTWSESWIDVLLGVLLWINRAVKSSNRSVFFVYNYPCPYLLQCMMRLLPFSSADRHKLLPHHPLLPAALFLQSWLLPFKAPAFVLSLPDSFALDPGHRAKGWHQVPAFLWAARMRVTKRGWLGSASHFVQWFFYPSGDFLCKMELKVKLSCFLLAAETQISSFLSYCLTFCLCLSVTKIGQMVSVFRFSALSNYWMMIRF